MLNKSAPVILFTVLLTYYEATRSQGSRQVVK